MIISTSFKASLIATIVVIGIYATGTQSIRIYPPEVSIETNDTEPEVTLPCIYKTDSSDSPQIEWYCYRGGTEERVMRVESNGEIHEGKNFTERVQRGEFASLILKAPKQEDSGTYACEIQITEDEPMFDKGLVKLKVKDGGCPQRDPCGKCVSNMPPPTGPLTMIAFDWIVPIVCFIGMLGGFFRISKSYVYSGKFRGAPRALKIFYIARTIASVTAMGFCFASMISLVMFTSSGCLTEPSNSHEEAGYTCGALGLSIFVIIVIGNYTFKKRYRPTDLCKSSSGQTNGVSSLETPTTHQLLSVDEGHDNEPRNTTQSTNEFSLDE